MNRARFISKRNYDSDNKYRLSADASAMAEGPEKKLQILFITTKYIEMLNPEASLDVKMIRFLEHVVNWSDRHQEEVHAEVVLNGTCYSAVGKYPDPCVLTYKFNPQLSALPCVELIDVPISDLNAAQDYLARATNTPARYHIPFAEFLLPKLAVDYVDPEYDFMDPSSWTRLYCSQFVLLFLRYCEYRRIISADSTKLHETLYSVSSHTCTPAHLAHMLGDLFKNP